MKKRIELIILIVFTLIFSTACQQKTTTDIISVGIGTPSDYTQYNYSQLKQAAEIIALVEVVDDLTEQNSVITYDDYDTDNQTIVGFYSLRKVKIIEAYKGDAMKEGDTLEVIEPTAVEGNQYYYTTDYEKMHKGGIYILFLGNNTASGNYSIISANNGRVDLSSIGNTQYYEIEAKAITEFLSDLPKTIKDRIIGSNVVQPGSDKDKLLDGEQQVTINDGSGTKVRNLTLKYGFDESTGVAYIKLE